jgi:hypothetical protein
MAAQGARDASEKRGPGNSFAESRFPARRVKNGHDGLFD